MDSLRRILHRAVPGAFTSCLLSALLLVLLGLPDSLIAARPPASPADSGRGEFERPSPMAAGTPRRLLSPLASTQPGSKSDPAAATLNTLAVRPDLMGAAPGEMEVWSVKETPKLTYVHLRRRIEDLPVLGTHAVFQWDAAGQLRLARGDARPRLDASHLSKAWSGGWVGLEEARTSALAGMPALLEDLEWQSAERAWLPVERAGSRELIPVWNIRFRTLDPPGWWDVLVDGETATLLGRENLAGHARVEGTVKAEIEPAYPGDPREIVPLHRARVAAGADSSSVSWSNQGGGFGFEVPGGIDWEVRTWLEGSYVRVEDPARGLLPPRLYKLVPAPEDPILLWDDANSTIQQRNAYYHIHRAHSFVRSLDSGGALYKLDRPISVRVDVPTSDPNYYCNAWWDGRNLNFYAARSSCPSYARIADVVYHEYGHAVTTYVYEPLLVPSAMSEAMSDYLAATMTGSPEIGRGAFGPGTVMRNIEDDKIWPDDASPIPHYEGLILGGTLWDLRKVLGPARTDSLFHFARYGGALSYDDYLLDMLVYDDDDHDLYNRTPNWDAITSAFRAHGLGDFSVHIEADPLTEQLDPGPYIETEARIWSLPGLDPGSLTLRARFQGRAGFEDVAVEPSELPQMYRARIPTPAANSEVSYYWYAENSEGQAATLPAGAPDAAFTFLVRPDTEPPALEVLAPDALAADAERICLQVRAEDNSGRLGPIRAEILLPGSIAAEELELPPAGSGTYKACLELGEERRLSVGDSVQFRILAEDLASPPNGSTWPAAGYMTAGVYAGVSEDLETDEGGLTGTGDWQWGAPPPGQNLSFSGTHVWGTVLDGHYRDNTVSTLTWGPVDLSSMVSARLEFRHRYRFENFYDGGNVKIRTGGNPRWTLIEPDGGYPENVRTMSERGYSGVSNGWERAVFALDRYLGEMVWFQFETATDTYVNDLGWYLDDLMVMEAQTLADPLSFQASGGEDSRVTLTWRPPSGIETDGPGFRGYTVYRTEGGAPFGDLALNPNPMAETRLVDHQVESGVTYTYRLHAVYPAGLSPGVVTSVTPAAGEVVLNTAQVEIPVTGFAPVDTSLVMRNDGDGILLFNTFVGEWTDEVDGVRLVHDLEFRPVQSTIRLREDPEDPGVLADLKALDLRQWIEPGGREMLEIRIHGHRPWGDPRRDWGGYLLIDTDGNLNTSQGDRDLGWGETRNIGYEYAVAFGRFITDAGFYGSEGAVLLDAQQTHTRLPLPYVEMTAGADSISFSIPLEALGHSRRLQLALFVAGDRGSGSWDQIPDLPDQVPWLDRYPRFGTAQRAHTRPLQIRADAAGLPNGTYLGRIILESNDPDDPVIRIEVRMKVQRGFPAEMARREFASELDGMRLTVDMQSEVGPSTVRAERRVKGTGAWQEVAGPLDLVPGSGVTLRDSTVVQGVKYEYRFWIARLDDARFVYGPFTATYRPEVPDLQSMDTVLTDRAVELRAVLPELPAAVWGIRWERMTRGDSVWVQLPAELASFDSAGTAAATDRWVPAVWEGAIAGSAYEYRLLAAIDTGVTLVFDGFEVEFDPGVPAELVLHPARPNPFRGQVLLQLDLPEGGPVRLALFDVQGRRIQLLEDQERPAGIHRYVWNGRDDSGRSAPSGIYWARASTPAGTRSVRVLRLK